jgi:hypothetical protein
VPSPSKCPDSLQILQCMGVFGIPLSTAFYRNCRTIISIRKPREIRMRCKRCLIEPITVPARSSARLPLCFGAQSPDMYLVTTRLPDGFRRISRKKSRAKAHATKTWSQLDCRDGSRRIYPLKIQSFPIGVRHLGSFAFARPTPPQATRATQEGQGQSKAASRVDERFCPSDRSSF